MKAVTISPRCLEAYPWMQFGYCFVKELAPMPDMRPLRERQQLLELHVRENVATLSHAAKAISRFYKTQGEKNRSHIESLVRSIHNGKTIKPVNYIVDSVMVAELTHALPLGVHDMNLVRGDILLDVAVAGEQFEGIGGRTVVTRPNEVVLRDEIGVWASYTQGPDSRTIIQPGTRDVMFLGFFTPETHREQILQGLHDAVGTLLQVAEGRADQVTILP